jgi:Kef-type K+ transport system membrane component KefB
MAISGEDIGIIILDLAIIFTMAKVAGLLCEWATAAMKNKVVIPGVIGEILVGVILGNTLLYGALNLDSESTAQFFEVFAELGVIFLLFAVGLETPYSELSKVGKKAFLVALLGVVIPFFGGYLLFIGLNYGSNEAMFVGAAMVATSVGITARVIKDLHLMNSVEARIIIGAAVIDDVMGLIVLSIVIAMAEGDSGSYGDTVLTIMVAILFVVITILIGSYISKTKKNGKPFPVVGKVNHHLNERRRKRSFNEDGTVCHPNTPEGRARTHTGLYLALILCLFLSAISTFLGLAAIVGAFLAGMLFAEFQDRWFCKEKIETINEFIVPFFFVFVGVKVDIDSFSAVIGIALILTIVAVATKFVGCGLGSLSMGRTSAGIVGSGMFPRGEVAMIVATIGLAAGIVEDSVFGMVVFMAIATTLISPPVLTYFFNKKYGKIGGNNLKNSEE